MDADQRRSVKTGTKHRWSRWSAWRSSRRTDRDLDRAPGSGRGEPDRFIDAVFALGQSLRHESAVTRADYAARIVRGGLPEATARTAGPRRERFFDAYVQALIDRDVRQLADLQHKGRLRTLVRLLAARAGTIIAPGALGIRPGTEPADGGPLLESFVLSELARQLTWSDELADLYHYRDHSKFEVDAAAGESTRTGRRHRGEGRIDGRAGRLPWSAPAGRPARRRFSR